MERWWVIYAKALGIVLKMVGKVVGLLHTKERNIIMTVFQWNRSPSGKKLPKLALEVPPMSRWHRR